MFQEYSVFVIAYIVGSINFAYLIGKTLGVDISKFGDGNLGATNLYYALGQINKNLAIFSFILAAFLDILKAYIVTVFFGPLVGSITILGHCFSIISFLLTRKFPSGVGFASSLGWALAIDIRILILALPFISFYIFFKKYFEWERGHSYYSYAVAMVGWLYTTFFNRDPTITLSFIFIAIITGLARFIRLKEIFEKCRS